MEDYSDHVVEVDVGEWDSMIPGKSYVGLGDAEVEDSSSGGVGQLEMGKAVGCFG